MLILLYFTCIQSPAGISTTVVIKINHNDPHNDHHIFVVVHIFVVENVNVHKNVRVIVVAITELTDFDRTAPTKTNKTQDRPLMHSL